MSSIDIIRDDGLQLSSLEIKQASYLFLGLGFKYNNRYSFEIKYKGGKDVLPQYSLWQSEFKTLSLVFGYTLF